MDVSLLNVHEYLVLFFLFVGDDLQLDLMISRKGVLCDLGAF